jgi:hypothetical protein
MHRLNHGTSIFFKKIFEINEENPATDLSDFQEKQWPKGPISSDEDPLQLLLSFFPALCPINNQKMGDIEMEMIPQEGIRQMLRFQIFGRIHSVQEMMLNAVKNAQREFPSVIYFREEASKLIKVGDKGDFFLIPKIFE